jgi:hypothetical protein
MHFMDSVLVGSTVHFYSNSIQQSHCIASFDLEAEEWTSIPGPSPAPGDEDETYSLYYESTLAGLNGYLVVVHYHGGFFETTDLWFLTDVENRQWEKKYDICAQSVLRPEEFAKPLLLLDDGRIVIFLGAKGVPLLYDPTNNVVSEVGTKRLAIGGVAMYAGSLLSLQSDTNDVCVE